MANKPVTITNKSRALMIRETITSYLFLAPFLVFFVMFVIYPMFMCVYTSFFDATMIPLAADYYQVTTGWAEARTNWWNMLQEVGASDGSIEAITEIVNTRCDMANGK